jgi:hypothetical protein
MTAVKERILGALTVMSNEDAEKIWLIIKTNFDSSLWDKIEEIEPDEWDKKMLDEIESDPDCKEFVSADEVYKSLGIE